jgi:hypothetical protein
VTAIIRANVAGWKPSERPDISDLDMWPGAPWRGRINGRPVDHARTDVLEQVDVQVRCHVGVERQWGGVPYQRVDGRAKKNVVPVKFWTRMPWRVPLPPTVHRVDDPLNSPTSDAQAFLIDGTTIYELSAAGPGWLGFQAGSVNVQQIDGPWGNQPSTCAGRIPMLAMLPTVEELLDGHIPHALHMAGPASPRFHPPARGSDGLFPDHPIEYGDRLRLRPDRAELLLASSPNICERAVIEAYRDYGGIWNDRTGPHALTRLPMDPRVRIKVDLRLTDFEIVRT